MPENHKISKLFQRIQAASFLKDDVVNFVFNNMRNLGLSLLPLVAAKAYVKDLQGDSGVLVWVTIGVFVIAALLLLLLNILHGWRKISELRISLWVIFPAAVFYAFSIAVTWFILLTAKP